MKNYADFSRWCYASKKGKRKIIHELKGNIDLRIKILKAIEYTSIAIILAFLLVLFVDNLPTYEYRYAIGKPSNGVNYTYVTERKCEVVEITETEIFVEYKGNVYSYFYDRTERQLLRVGDTVYCQFTDDWEIVGTTKWEVN